MNRNFLLEIDGKKLPVTLEQAGNEMSIALGDKTFGMTLDRKKNLVDVHKDGIDYRVAVRKINSRVFEAEMFGEVHSITIEEVAPGQPHAAEAEEAVPDRESGEEYFTIKTPIPGTLVSIEVKPGEKVEKGDCVCIVEAMKLYNEIESPHAGVVREIKASPGKPIKMGTELVVLSVKLA